MRDADMIDRNSIDRRRSMLIDGARWTQGACCGKCSSESKERVESLIPAVCRDKLTNGFLRPHERAWLCSSVPEIDVVTLLQKRSEPLVRATGGVLPRG